MATNNYVHNAYPSKRYHPDGSIRRVVSAEEDAALMKEDKKWSDSPDGQSKRPEVKPQDSSKELSLENEQLQKLSVFILEGLEETPKLDEGVADCAIRLFNEAGEAYRKLEEEFGAFVDKGNASDHISTPPPPPSEEPPNQDEDEQAAEQDHPFTAAKVKRLNKAALLGLAREFYKIELPTNDAEVNAEELKERIVALIEGNDPSNGEQWQHCGK